MYSMLGLQQKYLDEYEVIYYYNEDLLNDGIFIEDVTVFNDGKDNLPLVQDMLTIKYINNKNAHIFVMYWDDILAPIQKYRILKDLLELHRYNSLDTFINILSNFSTSYMSSEMQSEKKHRIDIYNQTKREFDFVKGMD